MRKIILGLLLFLGLSVPVSSQEPLFFPLILKGTGMPTIVEKWKIISPVESTNYVLNPSAEIASNFSALGGATVARSTTYQKYGVYSYRVQTGSNGQGASLTLSTLPNENCFATARIRGKLPIKLRFIIGNGIKTPLLIEKIDTQWSLYGVEFAALECNGRTELRIIQQGNGIGDFYVDGIQVENLEYWTSYIDGDQEGCNWNGPSHAATSTRSGKSYAGGQVKDLYKDYGFLVDKVTGVGATTRTLGVDEYAFLPGGELNEIKVHPRDWNLIGRFIADSDDELYQNRQDLEKLLKKNPYKQPVKFLFYHPKGVREIEAFYGGGLEADQSVFYDSWVTEGDDAWAELNKYTEKAAMQLRSPDPYFYGQGDKTATLDTNDSATFRIAAGRLKSTGQWDDLGPPGAPGTAVYSSIRTIVEDATYIYMGGSFQNFDNQANADYIVRYNKQTGLYSPMGTGANNLVWSLTIGPDGFVYAVGQFTSMGGVANTNRVARWNPTTGAWSAMGTGMNDSTYAVAVGLNGYIYAGGDFTTAGGAARSHVAYWTGTTWADMGGGTNAVCTVNAIAVGPSGLIYVGGNSITTVGAVSVSNIAVWDPDAATWADMGGGVDDTVRKIAVSSTGIVYAGGAFITAGGNSASKIASWNGSSWNTLGSGMDATVWALSIGEDGILYAGGFFSTAGGISLNDRIARWNGYTWSHLDIDLPGSPIVYSVYASKYVDAVIPQKYDLYLGFDTTGTGYFAGKTTVTNEGSVDVFPKFIYERSNGQTITIETIRNESTGKELLLNYNLLDGERLTIDLSPTRKSVISSYFGSRFDAVLANSDFGTFLFEIGSNDITSFVDNDNIGIYPTEVTAWVVWKETYEGLD